MTLATREPVLTATRAATRVGDNLATLGMHVSFYFRTLASIPYALSKFRKHVIAQISEVSFGTQSLLSGGGTIGIVFAMSLAAAMMLGVETQRGLELVGMTTMSGMLSAVANTRELAPPWSSRSPCPRRSVSASQRRSVPCGSPTRSTRSTRWPSGRSRSSRRHACSRRWSVSSRST